nr:proline-rich receptor-like protein kinase PERK9 [Aegilops tauschii subsp. strangulata]
MQMQKIISPPYGDVKYNSRCKLASPPIGDVKTSATRQPTNCGGFWHARCPSAAMADAGDPAASSPADGLTHLAIVAASATNFPNPSSASMPPSPRFGTPAAPPTLLDRPYTSPPPPLFALNCRSFAVAPPPRFAIPDVPSPPLRCSSSSLHLKWPLLCRCTTVPIHHPRCPSAAPPPPHAQSPPSRRPHCRLPDSAAVP